MPNNIKLHNKYMQMIESIGKNVNDASNDPHEVLDLTCTTIEEIWDFYDDLMEYFSDIEDVSIAIVEWIERLDEAVVDFQAAIESNTAKNLRLQLQQAYRKRPNYRNNL